MPDESAVVQAESDNGQREGAENATDDGQGRRGANAVRIGVGLPLEHQLQWRHHATRHGSMVERKEVAAGRRRDILRGAGYRKCGSGFAGSGVAFSIVVCKCGPHEEGSPMQRAS